jgi:hypothetical protein
LGRRPSLDLFSFYGGRETAKPELKRVLASYGIDPDDDPDSDSRSIAIFGSAEEENLLATLSKALVSFPYPS